MKQQHVSGSLLSALALTGALALGLSFSSQDQAPNRRITVRGSATVPLDGDVLELRLVVTGEGELASDAHGVFSTNRARTIEAFNALGIEGLEVQGLGRALAYEPPEKAGDAGNQRVYYGNGVVHIDGAQYWEVLLVTVPGQAALDAETRGDVLAQVVDAAVDNGVELLGGQRLPENRASARFGYAGDAPAQYLPADRAAVERRAYLAAIENARNLARELAAAEGGAVGAPLTVDLQPTTVVFRRGTQGAYYSAQNNTVQPEPEAGSHGAVRATVTVGFQLQ